MAKKLKNNPLDRLGNYTATLAAIKLFEKFGHANLVGTARLRYPREILPQFGRPLKEQRNELWNEIAIYGGSAGGRGGEWLDEDEAGNNPRRYAKLVGAYLVLCRRLEELEQFGDKVYS